MLRSLTAKQFTEWETYARMEPFNELRADHRAALIAQTVFNIAVDGKDRRPLTDFLLSYGDEEKPAPKRQPVEHQIAIAQAIAMAYSVPAKDIS